MFGFIFNSVPSVSTAELSQRLSENISILDVRTPSEYRSGHLPTAKNVPLSKISSYSLKEKQVYVICQSGMRSRQAAKQLKKKGYEAINVRGGMNQWTGKIRGGK
ncbi:rhodanese-like domain-containing protein [Enterococcus olivae]